MLSTSQRGETIFCPQCGANNRDAASFCRQCGEAIAARAGEGESPRSGRLLLFALGAAIAVAAAIVFVVATTGDGEGSSAPATAQESPTPASSSPAATGASPTASPSAAATEPVAEDDEEEGEGDTEEQSFVDEVLAALSEPSEGTGPTTGGIARFGVMAVLIEILVESGLDLSGLELWVLSMGTGEGALLVLEIDEAKAGTLLADEEAFQDALTNLLSAPAIDDASITQIAFNYYGTDDEGAYVATITMPLALARASASGDGELSADAASGEFLVELTRR